MDKYATIFESNKEWLEKKLQVDPSYFKELAKTQSPDFMYIGCSDSRVTAEEIMGLGPGEVFVHRNIANLVNNNDLSVLSGIEYAVDFLDVKHIIVCGHFNCGGVKSAMLSQDLGLLNPWLRNIRDVYRMHETELKDIQDMDERYDRLVALNVLEQCTNVLKTAVIQKKYNKNKYPIVHGWVFDLKAGKIIDLEFDHEHKMEEIKMIYNLTDL